MPLLNNLKFMYGESAFISSNNSFVSLLKRVSLVAYCLPNLSKTVSTLSCENNPLFAKELLQRPGLREFIYRPYMNIRWNSGQRLATIAKHYQLVNQHAALLNVDNHHYVDLFDFDFNDQKLRVVLDKPSWNRREGEISLSLFLDIDRIYSAMFTLSGDNQNINLMIGCLQGDYRDTNDKYKEITKALHGLRPRDLLLNMLKIMAKQIGCREIYGIADEAHRSNHWYSRAYKKSQYNEIWLEHNGILNAAGFFAMPAEVIKRNDEDIPTKKRALYRRRYEFLDEIKSKFQTFSFSSLTNTKI